MTYHHVISALYIFSAPTIFVCLIGLTESFSSEVFFKSISSDQAELLQSVAVLFFATSGDEGTDYFIIGGRNGFCPRLRLLQFRLPGLAALVHFSCPLAIDGTQPFLILRGVEGIRRLFGSGVSTYSSLDAYLGCSQNVAPIQLLPS